MIDERLVEIINKGEGFVAIIAGSGSDDKAKGDKPSHIGQIVESIDAFKIPYGVHICSAHKQPTEAEELIEHYNGFQQPILLVAVAGGTDALSGTLSWASYHPVVSCPPDALNDTCLRNPPGSCNAYIQRPANIGKYAAQMFSHCNESCRQKLETQIEAKKASLIEDDENVSKKYLDKLLGGKNE